MHQPLLSHTIVPYFLPTLLPDVLYPLTRSLLFRLEAEKSHDLTLPVLNKLMGGAIGRRYASRLVSTPIEVMGLRFPNRIGLAAGLDKNGDFIDGLGNLGFGFIEVGTVTPKPQPGNPKPRLFRLARHDALINRFGFNNKGVDHLVEQVQKRRYAGVLGINIGKNKDTPNESAIDDYVHCFKKVYEHADYITINISSPNTPGLRELQHGDARADLLRELKKLQRELADKHSKLVPMAVKIAPDMSEAELDDFVDDALATEIDAIIATNTTNSRDEIEGSPHAGETGGLSGAPLTSLALATQTRLGTRLAGRIPVIGVGGIQSTADAADRINAGASLLQVYTGFIYKGPALIRQLLKVVD